MSSYREDQRDQKDPTWNGEQHTWADYTRRVRLAYETTPSRKRKLLGPRLALRLTGRAWEIISHIDHERLRRSNGSKYLLAYLREHLGRTPIPDAAQRLEELFIRLRRVPGEGFAEWAVRVKESYKRVQRSLARARTDVSVVIPKAASTTPSTVSRASRRLNTTGSEPAGEPPSPSRATAGTTARAGTVEEEETGDQHEAFRDVEEEDDGADEWLDDSWWYGWSWQGPWQWKRQDSGTDDDDDQDDIPDHMAWADLEAEETEILPSEILGWILLRRAGLSTASRLSVQAATHNSLKFEVVEKALRDQQEELLLAEHQHLRNAGSSKRSYWVEDSDSWGLVMDNIIEEEAVNDDQIHWMSSNQQPVVNQAFTAEAEEEDTWFDGVYEWAYWSQDGEWHTMLDDGSYVAYTEMKPWMDIDEIAYHDGDLAKEVQEIYSTFENKVRTFREARHALHQKGKNRGYFRPKGKGKGKGKKGNPFGKGTGSAMVTSKGSSSGPGKGGQKSSVSVSPANRPGFTGCFICGDMSHDYRSCPKRSQPGPSGKGGTFTGFVDAEETYGEECYDVGPIPGNTPSDVDPFDLEDARDYVDHLKMMAGSPLQGEALMVHGGDDQGPEGEEDLMPSVMAAKETVPEGEDRFRYAVVDTGATETVGSLDALDFISKRRVWHPDERVVVDPSCHKTFRFGNGDSKRSSSFVHLPQRMQGIPTSLGVYAMDVPEVPVLLGIRTLRRLGALSLGNCFLVTIFLCSEVEMVTYCWICALIGFL